MITRKFRLDGTTEIPRVESRAHSPVSSSQSVVLLTIPGAPRTKKTSNKIAMAGKKKVVKPSKAWLEWRDNVKAWFFKRPPAWRRQFPLETADYNAAALFYRHANVGDATGFYQGIADVLQEVGFINNDRELRQWDGSRLLVDAANPRVEITLTKI